MCAFAEPIILPAGDPRWLYLLLTLHEAGVRDKLLAWAERRHLSSLGSVVHAIASSPRGAGKKSREQLRGLLYRFSIPWPLHLVWDQAQSDKLRLQHKEELAHLALLLHQERFSHTPASLEAEYAQMFHYSGLNPQQAQLVGRYLGLSTAPVTLQATGDLAGVTRERIRQLVGVFQAVLGQVPVAFFPTLQRAHALLQAGGGSSVDTAAWLRLQGLETSVNGTGLLRLMVLLAYPLPVALVQAARRRGPRVVV